MKDGWKTKMLAETCDVFVDGDWVESRDQSPKGIRLIQTGNVGEGAFKDRGEKARYISEATFKRLRCTEIFEGDCLISRLPDPVGRSCILPDTGERMITAVDCTILRFNPQVIPEFFNYYSQSGDYISSVDAKTRGTTRKRISRSMLGQTPIPLPPLPEQHRIVAILDKAFEGIATAKANAEKSLKNARAVFESHLNAVFSQGGEGWVEAPLGTVTTKIGSGATPLGGEASYQLQGIALVRSLNVHDSGFRHERLAFINELQASKLANAEVCSGDVLFNITGASVTRCCVVPAGILPARVNQHVSILRPAVEVLVPEFLHYLLTSRPYKNRLLETAEDGGSTRQAITQTQLRAFTIAIPMPNVQRHVVEDLRAIESEAKHLESLYQQKLVALDNLKQSLLHQAFSGVL